MNTSMQAPRRTSPVSSRSAERGSIMLWATLAVILIASVLTLGLDADRALDRASSVLVEAPAQARAVAEAGLVDAYAWFRRQTVQPVSETDDPDIGLVREYEIGPNLWARYEVRREAVAEPFSDVNRNGLYDEGEPYTDENDDGEWDAGRETQDISHERGQSGQGAIWLLVSHGCVGNQKLKS